MAISPGCACFENVSSEASEAMTFASTGGQGQPCSVRALPLFVHAGWAMILLSNWQRSARAWSALIGVGSELLLRVSPAKLNCTRCGLYILMAIQLSVKVAVRVSASAAAGPSVTKGCMGGVTISAGAGSSSPLGQALSVAYRAALNRTARAATKSSPKEGHAASEQQSRWILQWVHLPFRGCH